MRRCGTPGMMGDARAYIGAETTGAGFRSVELGATLLSCTGTGEPPLLGLMPPLLRHRDKR